MRKGYLFINEEIIPTLLAVTADEQAMGLMYVEPPTPVMSFLYSQAQINKFWMKSTPSELDIVFSLNGKVTNICKGEPYSTTALGGDLPSDLVVELPYGTCKKMGIEIGSPIGVLKNIKI